MYVVRGGSHDENSTAACQSLATRPAWERGQPDASARVDLLPNTSHTSPEAKALVNYASQPSATLIKRKLQFLSKSYHQSVIHFIANIDIVMNPVPVMRFSWPLLESTPKESLSSPLYIPGPSLDVCRALGTKSRDGSWAPWPQDNQGLERRPS